MAEEIIFCIDMQREYVTGFPGGYIDACASANMFNTEMNDQGVPTWRIYFDHGRSFGLPLIDANTPFEIREGLLRTFCDNNMDDLSDIKAPLDAPIIFKRRSSAFHNPQLQPFLEQNGVKKIYMEGYSGTDCVAATAIDAAKLGYEVILVKDLTFSNPAMANLGRNHATDETIKDWLEKKFLETLGIAFPEENPFLRRTFAKINEQLYEGEKKTYTNEESFHRRTLLVATLAHKDFKRRQKIYRENLKERFEQMKTSAHPDYLALASIKFASSDAISRMHRPVRARGFAQQSMAVRQNLTDVPNL